jgi:aspartyl-tRNA(Asn)/glutamyl-tRNA(Gln) amidotransferase subunit A
MSAVTDIPLSVAEAGERIRTGALTATDLTAAVLARAEEYDGSVGAFLARFDEQALEAAEQADRELSRGVDRGPLHGIPLGLKDIIAAAEGPTTANSLVLDRAWGYGRDAPVVTRLRQAGAVIVGKTTLREFAAGLPDPSKPFPLPRNPWNLQRYAGGSSSGTGNGVAAGFFLGGLGTDTGGSIRIPAAYCGISGLMPTFGRVPKSGVVSLGYSLDRVGPMARCAQDCAFMLQAIAGPHPSDPDAADVPPPDYAAALTRPGLDGLTIGIDRAHHSPENADPAAATCFDSTLAVLSALGATVVDVSLPYYDEMVAADLLTLLAEGTAYHLPSLQARWADYSADTRRTLARGVMLSGADFVQAQRVRRVALRALTAVFAQVDVVATPTVSTGAPVLEHMVSDSAEIGTLFRSVHTPYWNSVGNPVLVVPMGFTADGLPLSLQLAGRPFDEATLLMVGHVYQCATDWHRLLPPLAPATVRWERTVPARVAAPVGAMPRLERDATVRSLLAAAGIAPPEEEMAGVIAGYGTVRAMVDLLRGVDAAREETPALRFDPRQGFADWGEAPPQTRLPRASLQP